MLARGGVADHAADVLAILDDGVAGLQRLQSDLVTDRNVVLGDELGRRIVLSDDAQHVGAGLQVLDNDDADVVLWAVYEKMWNFRHCSSPDEWRPSPWPPDGHSVL